MPDIPASTAEGRPMKTGKRKIGLALGSGAARGLAHIGVLKAFEEEGIQIDCIAGTSIGAFIGALYAAGVPVEKMEQVASQVDWRQLARLIDPILPTSGIIDGKKVSRFISELLPAKTFEQLRIPLAVTTTDIETGEALVIKKGNLHEALRAAIAFPGIFTPVRFFDRFLMDGGLCNPVPVDVVRNLGARSVIGVCAIPAVMKETSETYLPSRAKRRPGKPFLELLNAERIESFLREMMGSAATEEDEPREGSAHRKPPGIFRIFSQSVAIMENQINALRLEKNQIDLLIRPPLNGINLLEFHRAAEAIAAGEEATRKVMPKIRKMAGR